MSFLSDTYFRDAEMLVTSVQCCLQMSVLSYCVIAALNITLS